MKKTRSVLALVFATVFATIFASVGFAEEIPTASYVDLQKYVGKWYEVASIPQSFQKQCVANTTAEYSLADDGLIKVLNSCDTDKGKRSVAEARAKVIDKKTNSKLKVTFVKIFDWIFAFGGNYWILDLAPDYSYALIGDPTREYAWILSRTPSFAPELFIKAEATFKALGYDTCAILTSVQSEGIGERVPLCKVAERI